jgi:hypothetical protein
MIEQNDVTQQFKNVIDSTNNRSGDDQDIFPVQFILLSGWIN